MTKTKIFAALLFLSMLFLYINYFSSFVMPWQKEAAIKSALSWGQLSELPKDAEITHMEKRGSAFTRQYIIEFKSSESEIKKWILESKGFKNNKPKIINGTRVYEIHPKGFNPYGGKVKIKENVVYINMSWS